MTSAFAAATPQRTVVNTDVFHSLFSDPGRSTPVAALVSQLWGVSGASPTAMSWISSRTTGAAARPRGGPE